ncbi:hypothetical protein M153_905000129 [Pseudoloma neurophilia]|uniref:Uncharacterized protein n=1 Tax=Pseudoloma neurophilia TaxID=146866 RepID=A0A0R0M1A7_9MICR|nr:hypothetical protein M153_905000129 [Pseudoloma neurophilia]
MFFDSFFTLLGNIIFITSPCIGFLPQLLKKNITFAPLLSTVLILANSFKIVYLLTNGQTSVTPSLDQKDIATSTSISWTILFQSLFLIFFHLLLLFYSTKEFSILEERIFINKYTAKAFKNYGTFGLLFTFIFTGLVGYLFLSYLISGLLWLSCPLFLVLECSIGLLQLAILETDSFYSLNKSVFPKELFLMWALGDLLKLAWLIRIDGEGLICLSVAFQIVIGLAVVLRYGGILKRFKGSPHGLH